jgi:hypothetical protein
MSDELDALIRQRTLLQLEKKRADLIAKNDSIGMDDVRGAVQSVNRGSLFGFGDEIVGAGRAAIDPLIGLVAGEENVTDGYFSNFGDRYKAYRDDERDVTKQFEKENPKTALGLTIAGGIASPVNRIAPGFGGVGSTTGKTLARGTAEGAAVGLGEGEGDFSQQAKSAATGAGFGFGATGLMKGLGGIGNQFSKQRRTADTMYRDVDGVMQQVPIHMQGDGRGKLSNFTRNMLGGSIGGQTTIRRQEDIFLDSAKKGLEEAGETKTGLTKALKNTKEEIQSNYTNDSRNIADAAKSAIAKAKVDTGLTGDAATLASNKTIQSIRGNLRQETGIEAMPLNGRIGFDGIDMADTNAVNSVLKEFYRNKAFREVKDAGNFKWDGDIDKGLKKSIRQAMSDDPDLAINAAGKISELKSVVDKLKKSFVSDNSEMLPEDFIEELLNSTKITGIDGEALMAIRNVFARSANKETGRSNRLIANQIDDLIRKQLPEESVAQFDDQLARYTTFLAHDSAANAPRATKLRGKFDEDELLNAGRKFEGLGSRNNPRPMKEEAISAYESVVAAQESASNAVNQAQRNLEKATANATKDQTTLTRAAQSASKQALKKAIEAEEKAVQKLNILGKTKDFRQMSKMASTRDKSPLSTILTTRLLGGLAGGGLVGGLVGGPVGAGIGMGMAIGGSTALGSKAGQRLMTGNTGLQQGMQNLGSNTATRNIANELRRQISLQSARSGSSAINDEEEY